MNWEPYFLGLAAFAGTVFAVTLAARQIVPHAFMPTTQSDALHSDATLVAKWDSVAVTYELAASAMFAIAVIIRGSFTASGLVVLAAALGGCLIYRHGRAYLKLRRSGTENLTWKDDAWASANVLPLSAYVLTASLFVWGDFFGHASAELLAAAITWLTLSGTYQAVAWYERSWAKPPVAKEALSPV